MVKKYNLDDGKIFVKSARKIIKNYLETSNIIFPEELKKYNEKAGVFVTLRKNNKLRGCIGFPRPIYPLWKALAYSSISAATNDLRFPPLTLEELNKTTIEVSILTEPELIKVKDPLEYPEKIKVGRDGLIIEYGIYSGLLLPEVPVEEKWNEIEFLSYTCLKAGLPPDCWIKYPIKIYKFTSQIFKEIESNGKVVEVKLEEQK